MYQAYSLPRIILRRVLAVVAGVLVFPVALLTGSRSRIYSYLHRVWLKTSTKPVWLQQSEQAGGIIY